MATDIIPSTPADHLVVLVHGLWGNPQHLAYLSQSLREKYPEDKLHILVAKRNSGNFTYDGIEVGGERVASEIEEFLEEAEQKGQSVKKLSVVGYSLGGLVARYTIGLLHYKGWFDKIEPVNFTTFASPHLGVRTPLLGLRNKLWNGLGARILSASGRQLFTVDSFRDTGRPLLAVLADPESIFIHALTKFKHRSLYSNIVNDRSAVFYTTAISPIDPYVQLQDVNINYLKGYEPIILDPDNPVSPKVEPGKIPTFFEQVKSRLKNNPILILFFILLPLFVVLFLLNSVVQSFRSQKRIKLHHQGKAGMDFGVYRIPLMIEGVRRTAENMFENINNSHKQEYLPAGTKELATSPTLTTNPKKSSSNSSFVSTSAVTDKTSGSIEQKAPAQQTEFPTLALTPDQFSMIQALDEVGWRKYRVHIHNIGHSHAAIIVRTQKSTFDEGKVVVKHWLDEFEI